MEKQTYMETRKTALNLMKKGKSFRKIDEIVKRIHNKVMKIIEKYVKYKYIKHFQRTGRPKQLTNMEVKTEVKGV